MMHHIFHESRIYILVVTKSFALELIVRISTFHLMDASYEALLSLVLVLR
jgi:hypothetical protein